MKLSLNMLNFLGYMTEDHQDFLGLETSVGLATHKGIEAALKNGLIDHSVYTLVPVKGLPLVPGMPYGSTYTGYKITEKGKAIAEFGKKYRNGTFLEGSESGAELLKEAQAALDGYGG